MATRSVRKRQTGRARPQANEGGVQCSIPPIGQAIDVLKKALPYTDPELIGGICASLFDLWETGQTLDQKMRELLMFQFPRDRPRLHDTLI
jgi:hypothetical protein